MDDSRFLVNTAIQYFTFFWSNRHNYFYLYNVRTKNFFPTFVMLFTLLACRSPQTSFSNSHYSNEIDVASNYQIAWQDLLKQEEENYLVFVYSEWCNNCHDIRDDVISFVNQKAITLYFVDINRSINNIPISEDIESTYGAKEVGEISYWNTDHSEI